MKTISWFFFLIVLAVQLSSYTAFSASDLLESDIDTAEPSLEETDTSEKSSEFSTITEPEGSDPIDEEEGSEPATL